MPLSSAFRAWWMHPQLRPALGSRREAGALPTGSADPPARDCTRLLHVSLLVVANAHMGHGFSVHAIESSRALHLGPLLDPGSLSTCKLIQTTMGRGGCELALSDTSSEAWHFHVQVIPLWLQCKGNRQRTPLSQSYWSRSCLGCLENLYDKETKSHCISLHWVQSICCPLQNNENEKKGSLQICGHGDAPFERLHAQRGLSRRTWKIYRTVGKGTCST